MIADIDAVKDWFGVEPICRVLPIAHPPPTTPAGGRRRPAGVAMRS